MEYLGRFGYSPYQAYLLMSCAPIQGHVLQKLARFDFLGSVLFTISAVAFLFGLTTGGVMFAWSSHQTLVPLIIGFAGMTVFVWWEFNMASEPLLEKKLFGTWTATATYLQTMIHALVMWAVLYFLGKSCPYLPSSSINH